MAVMNHYLVLVGLGVEHAQAWHFFSQLKAFNTDLPVLVYQIVNGQGVDDFKRAVAAALIEVEQRTNRQHESLCSQNAIQLLG